MKTLAAAVFSAEELAAFTVPPAWRKATRNMIMATASIERALSLIDGLSVERDEQVALILGSSSGELETSAEFLSTWAQQRMARPVLFQNSLHNASTGFASIQFKLSGPSFTVSAAERTPLECVELARMLLAEKHAKICLVTLVEGHRSLSEPIGMAGIREGACSIVVANAGAGRNIDCDLLYSIKPADSPLFDIQESEVYKWAVSWGLAQ